MLMALYAFLGWLAVALLAWNLTKLSERVDRLIQQQQRPQAALLCPRCNGPTEPLQSNTTAKTPPPARTCRTH